MKIDILRRVNAILFRAVMMKGHIQFYLEGLTDLIKPGHRDEAKEGA